MKNKYQAKTKDKIMSGIHSYLTDMIAFRKPKENFTSQNWLLHICMHASVCQRAQVTHAFDVEYSKDHTDFTASTKTNGLVKIRKKSTKAAPIY